MLYLFGERIDLSVSGLHFKYTLRNQCRKESCKMKIKFKKMTRIKEKSKEKNGRRW